jgi:hypothetical protein
MPEEHARGLGWKPNTVNTSHGPAHHLFSASPYILPAGDYRQLARDYGKNGQRIYQGQAGACWAFSTARCLQLYYAVRDIVAPVAAPGFMYWNGRREEYAGLTPESLSDELEDTGTEPRHGITALSQLGFCAWDDFPYTDNPVVIAKQPPDAAYLAAYSQKGLRWGVIETSGFDRIDQLDDMLKRGLPAQFGMRVDSAFMQWKGPGPISSIDMQHLRGGHMLTPLFVDYMNDCVWFDNWWEYWGPEEYDGMGKLSFKVFGDPRIVSDVIVMEYLPTLVRK